MLPLEMRRQAQQAKEWMLSAARERRERERVISGTSQMATQRESPRLIYFGNAYRVSPAQLRRELCTFLPRAAVRCIDFVGSSIMEILCDPKHSEKLIATLSAMGYRQIADFNPIDGGTKRLQGDNERERLCLARAQRMLQRMKSDVVQSIYSELVRIARERLKTLSEPTGMDTTNN